jgi:hypothetical protein
MEVCYAHTTCTTRLPLVVLARTHQGQDWMGCGPSANSVIQSHPGVFRRRTVQGKWGLDLVELDPLEKRHNDGEYTIKRITKNISG